MVSTSAAEASEWDSLGCPLQGVPSSDDSLCPLTGQAAQTPHLCKERFAAAKLLWMPGCCLDSCNAIFLLKKNKTPGLPNSPQILKEPPLFLRVPLSGIFP